MKKKRNNTKYSLKPTLRLKRIKTQVSLKGNVNYGVDPGIIVLESVRN